MFFVGKELGGQEQQKDQCRVMGRKLANGRPLVHNLKLTMILWNLCCRKKSLKCFKWYFFRNSFEGGHSFFII